MLALTAVIVSADKVGVIIYRLNYHIKVIISLDTAGYLCHHPHTN